MLRAAESRRTSKSEALRYQRRFRAVRDGRRPSSFRVNKQRPYEGNSAQAEARLRQAGLCHAKAKRQAPRSQDEHGAPEKAKP